MANIDPAGFEKYQKNEGHWVINDLENRVTVAIEKTEETVKIKVRSSSEEESCHPLPNLCSKQKPSSLKFNFNFNDVLLRNKGLCRCLLYQI